MSRAFRHNIFPVSCYTPKCNTANVVLDILQEVFGSRDLSIQFPQHFVCEWSCPPCSPDLNPSDYFFWGYNKGRVHRTNPHTVQELQAEIEAVTEEITGDKLRDTVDNLWFVYSESTRSKDLLLNMC